MYTIITRKYGSKLVFHPLVLHQIIIFISIQDVSVEDRMWIVEYLSKLLDNKMPLQIADFLFNDNEQNGPKT